jgi:hypothetical protein
MRVSSRMVCARFTGGFGVGISDEDRLPRIRRINQAMEFKPLRPVLDEQIASNSEGHRGPSLGSGSQVSESG